MTDDVIQLLFFFLLVSTAARARAVSTLTLLNDCVFKSDIFYMLRKTTLDTNELKRRAFFGKWNLPG